MGWRFRNSIRIAPGIRINMGKRKASLSVGGPGATINVGEKGARATIGIPGTGISYTTDAVSLPSQPSQGSKPGTQSSAGRLLLLALVAAIVLVVALS